MLGWLSLNSLTWPLSFASIEDSSAAAARGLRVRFPVAVAPRDAAPPWLAAGAWLAGWVVAGPPLPLHAATTSARAANAARNRLFTCPPPDGRSVQWPARGRSLSSAASTPA